MYLNLRRLSVLTMFLVLCLVFPTPAAAAEGGSWQDRASDLWDQAKDKGSELYESAKEKAPEVIDQAKGAASKVADTVREQAPAVIDKTKEGLQDAQEAVSDWNAEQRQQFWDHTEGLIYGNDSADASQDAAVEAIEPEVPTSEATPPIAESSDPFGPINENIVDYPEPKKLESGYYTIDGTLYHYDAENDEWGLATIGSPRNPSQDDDLVLKQLPDDVVVNTVYTKTILGVDFEVNQDGSLTDGSRARLGFIVTASVVAVILFLILVCYFIPKIIKEQKAATTQSTKYF